MVFISMLANITFDVISLNSISATMSVLHSVLTTPSAQRVPFVASSEKG
jgi:hypothetical protein